MVNIWLKRRDRRRVISELNKCLKKFAGYPADPLQPLIGEMRKEVLRYFKNNQEDLKLFVENGSLDYRFNISHKKGKVLTVEFEPLD